MKRFWGFITTIMLIICMAGSSLAAESVSQEVLDSTKSVVRIYVSYGDAGYATGSGFVVSSDENNTYVLTNYHVAVEDNPEYIAVILNSEADIQASVLCADKDHDLALLKIAFPLGMTPICFCKDAPSKGEAVYAIGFPGAADAFTETIALGSEDSTITDGIISAIRSVPLFEGGPNVRILQISAAINSGNSGGPLLNQKGEVIGIDTYAVEDSQGIFGAISESEIKAFLQVNNITYYVHAEQKDSGVPVWKIVVAVVGVGIVILVIVIILKKKRNEKYESFDVISNEKTEVPSAEYQQERKARRKKTVKIVGIVLSVLIVLVSAYFGTYALSKRFAAQGNLRLAEKWLLFPAITEKHDENLIIYTAAGKLLENKEYDSAKEQFAKIPDYMNSKDFCNECDYQKANALVESENYLEAISIYNSLGDYKDSDDCKNGCYYKIGEGYFRSKEFDKAIEAFTQANGYGDSQRCIEECEDEKKNIVYNQALGIINSDPDRAKQLLKTLGDFKDSQNQIKECDYIRAKRLLIDQRFTEAYSLLRELGDYKDSLEVLSSSIYKRAKKYYKEGDYNRATILFEEIKEYEDSNKYLDEISEAKKQKEEERKSQEKKKEVVENTKRASYQEILNFDFSGTWSQVLTPNWNVEETFVFTPTEVYVYCPHRGLNGVAYPWVLIDRSDRGKCPMLQINGGRYFTIYVSGVNSNSFWSDSQGLTYVRQ